MKDLLCAERIRLSALDEEDATLLEPWFNDGSFLRFYDMVPAIPQSRRELRDMLAEIHTAPDRMILGIRERTDGKLIGLAGFDEILWNNGVATCYIGIGDPASRRQGLAKEALGQLVALGFHELNFYRLQLDVIAYNTAAIRLYEGQGFRREGTYRAFIRRDGKRYDMYLYGLLREEWPGLQPGS
ncbi:MAG: GNAT family N-acetyltransferase [Peptococcaceae bacterium]|jgi:RimJ/RimL family protein N-acetyltransferase|nr:GNAT family N-acetyltransferase [Peptococcaceae bacterium]